jgi:hypoxanthine phosphoribosyltransferase
MLLVRDLYFEEMIPQAHVEQRVADMGAALSRELAGETPFFISILSGAFVFAADLIRHFEGPCEVSFVKLASYVGTQSTGAIQNVMGVQDNIEGRHVVVVEDIVDTGRTLHYFLEQLRALRPASVRTVALLRKPTALQFSVPVEHVGFDIEDLFVIGYGLDYEGYGRNLTGIYQIKDNWGG